MEFKKYFKKKINAPVWLVASYNIKFERNSNNDILELTNQILHEVISNQSRRWIGKHYKTVTLLEIEQKRLQDINRYKRLIREP